MAGAGKKSEAGSPGVAGWISSAYRFATDRNDFRRYLQVIVNYLPNWPNYKSVALCACMRYSTIVP